MVIFGDADSDMAAWNSVRDAGDANNAKIDVPPELWPKRVTRDASPPNAAIFC